MISKLAVFVRIPELCKGCVFFVKLLRLKYMKEAKVGLAGQKQLKPVKIEILENSHLYIKK